VKGDAIPVSMRLVTMCHEAEVRSRVLGVADATDVIRPARPARGTTPTCSVLYGVFSKAPRPPDGRDVPDRQRVPVAG
jgi:hypothetical protein